MEGLPVGMKWFGKGKFADGSKMDCERKGKLFVGVKYIEIGIKSCRQECKNRKIDFRVESKSRKLDFGVK